MNKCVIVRGGGDIATGTIYKLVKSGFQVLVLEVEKPSAIRRNVAFCQAVYEQKFTVEDMTCILVSTIEEAKKVMGAISIVVPKFFLARIASTKAICSILEIISPLGSIIMAT